MLLQIIEFYMQLKKNLAITMEKQNRSLTFNVDRRL